MHDKATSTSNEDEAAKANKFQKLKTFLSMTTFAFSIQKRDHEDRGGHRAELNCVLGNLFSEENNLGNSFMVKASSAEKMRQNPLVEKSFSCVLPLLSNFSALEIGGCCCCCSSCFKVRRLDERGRNFADCIFAIPLEAGGLFQRNVSKGGQSGFPTNASLVTAALMKLHLVKSNMRSFALASPQRLRDAIANLCANIQFPKFCGCCKPHKNK